MTRRGRVWGVVVLAGVAVALVSLAVLTARSEPGAAVTAPPSGADPRGAGNPFRERNGMVTHYVRDPEGYDGFDYPATTFASIREQIDTGWYADRGIGELFIYGPYRSSHHFLGLPALDYFDVQEGTGTVADWDAMAASAAKAGMPIVAYIELIYVHPQNAVFVKAAHDRASDIESFERNLFRWDDRPGPQATCPSNTGLPPALTWTRDPSIADGRCYVQAWGELAGTLPIGFPAFDFERPEAMDYAKRVLAFWMDHGVTGFFYDATHTYLGMHDPVRDPQHLARMRELHVTYPTEHVHPDGTRKPKLLHDEGTFGDAAAATTADLIGFTHVRVGGDGEVDTFATEAMRIPPTNGRSVDDLEDLWATVLDPRRVVGRGGLASLPYGDAAAMPGALRALDAAIQAGGAGATYYFSYQHHLPSMPAADQERLWEVLRAVASTPALAPGASRSRLPTSSSSDGHHAVLRRSMDGTQTALAVFNLAATQATITVDLTGTGIVTPQQTTDLRTGAPGPRLDGTESRLTLPGYGYAFLDVEAGPGTAWTVIDDADPGWSTDGGWGPIVDPSAFGGTRIGGNTQGGFAEHTFRGRAIEGYGRMGAQGAQTVEVIIDGVTHGVHSQRRPPPLTGGTTWSGQRLFAIGGLEPGEHTIRIVQRTGSGIPGSATNQHAGIDYLRSSSDPTTITEGDDAG